MDFVKFYFINKIGIMNPLIPVIKDKNESIVDVNKFVHCDKDSERIFKIVHIQNVYMGWDYIHSIISVYSLSIDKPVHIILQHVRNSSGTFVLIDGQGIEWCIKNNYKNI